MAETVVNVGQKGQILIPKLLRDQFGILPGQPALLQETEDGLLVKHLPEDPIRLFESIAQKVKASKKQIESVV